MQLGSKADALVAPKPNLDALGPCKRHPEDTEIAFFVISTAMVCFLLATALPLILSCEGAINRLLAKKPIPTERSIVAKEGETEMPEMRPWACARKYGLATSSAAAVKENIGESFVVNVHETLETEDQDKTSTNQEVRAPLAGDKINGNKENDVKEDGAKKEDKV